MGRASSPLRVEALCRGEGTGYVLLRGPRRLGQLRVEAALADGTAVPSVALPVDDWKDREAFELGDDEAWVLVVPQMDADLSLRVFCEGSELLSTTFPVGLSKIRSRLLTKRRPEVAKALRGFERRNDIGYAQVRIAEVWPNASNTLTWRVRACFPCANADGKPRLSILGTDARAADARIITMEDHVVPSAHDATRLVRLVTFSCTLPRSFGSFVAQACLPGIEGCAGFDVLFGPLVGQMVGQQEQRMGGAIASPHYGWWWFEDVRATRSELARQREAAHLDSGPLLSVLLGVGTATHEECAAAVASVRAQSYDRWELLIVGPGVAAADVAEATAFDGTMYDGLPAALLAARGDYVVFMDGSDVLEPDALHHVRAAVREHPDAGMLYSDEDRMTLADGHVHSPVFKTGLNRGKLYGYAYLGHALVASRALLGRVGYLDLDPTGPEARDLEAPGVLEYDLALRAIELDVPVEHIPRVLCHRLRNAYATCDQQAGRSVLAAHLARRGIEAQVADGPLPSTYRVRYALPSPLPKISIVIPTKDQADLLETCVMSILEKSTYPDYEVVLVENNSTQSRTFELYERLCAQSERVSVVVWEPEVPGTFNYSAIVNAGVAHATGDYLVLLNNDTEVIEPRWMEEMLACFARPEVGVVGAKLLYGDGLIQHVGMFANGNGDFAHVCQNLAADAPGPNRMALFPGDFSMVTGACQMVSRRLFDELGGYDEQLTVGFNDGDFCLRVWESGRVVTMCVEALLYHREFATRGRESLDRRLRERYMVEKARIMLKHPAFFAAGDWMTNPNIDPWSSYAGIWESGTPDL